MKQRTIWWTWAEVLSIILSTLYVSEILTYIQNLLILKGEIYDYASIAKRYFLFVGIYIFLVFGYSICVAGIIKGKVKLISCGYFVLSVEYLVVLVFDIIQIKKNKAIIINNKEDVVTELLAVLEVFVMLLAILEIINIIRKGIRNKNTKYSSIIAIFLLFLGILLLVICRSRYIDGGLKYRLKDYFIAFVELLANVSVVISLYKDNNITKLDKQDLSEEYYV